MRGGFVMLFLQRFQSLDAKYDRPLAFLSAGAFCVMCEYGKDDTYNTI